MQKILVCDDDHEIVEAISIYLSGEGFEVLKAYDGLEALKVMEQTPVDLLIVDVMMPGLDGIRTTLKVRETSTIPIIILSAKSEDNDKILGLNIGADDYLTKPFNPLELVARVKSQLRRYTELGNLSAEDNSHTFSVGDLVIDDETKEVKVSGNVVKLTPIEYNILLLLVRNAGKVFSIDEIYEKMLAADRTGDETNYLYGKALENARRVALILAVGRSGPEAVITEGDAVYACRLVKYLVGDLIRAVKETVAENNDEKAKKRILQIVAASGGGGISKRDLTRKTQFIRKSFRDEYVADLVESGELVVKFGANGGEVYFPGD